MERLVSEMTYNVLMATLNSYSLTGSSNVLHWQLPGYSFLGPQMYL